MVNNKLIIMSIMFGIMLTGLGSGAGCSGGIDQFNGTEVSESIILYNENANSYLENGYYSGGGGTPGTLNRTGWRDGDWSTSNSSTSDCPDYSAGGTMQIIYTLEEGTNVTDYIWKIKDSLSTRYISIDSCTEQNKNITLYIQTYGSCIGGIGTCGVVKEIDYYCISGNNNISLGSFFHNYTKSVTASSILLYEEALYKKYIKLNIINEAGEIIEGTDTSLTSNESYSEITIKENPITRAWGNLRNGKDAINLILNITSLTYQPNNTMISNVNGSTTEYNISMTLNKLFLNFSSVTSGEIFDEGNLNYRWNGTSLLIVQSNLTEGVVRVRFGENIEFTNWTQYFEYINNLETDISTELKVLTSPDWVVYYQVMDKARRPIPNALVTAYQGDFQYGNYTNYSKIGQRLTGADGTTFFMFNSNQAVKVVTTAEGFTPDIEAITIGDVSATDKSTAIPVYLEEDETATDEDIWITVVKSIYNRSLDIYGIIYAKDKNSVKITTDYAISQGRGLVTLEADSLERYAFVLESGTDFSATGTDDIIVYIYINDELYATKTIESQIRTEIIEFWDDIDSTYLNIGLFIALLTISLLCSIAFKSSTAGFSVFALGSIGAGAISSGFYWIGGIMIIFILARTISQKWLKEA